MRGIFFNGVESGYVFKGFAMVVKDGDRGKQGFNLFEDRVVRNSD